MHVPDGFINAPVSLAAGVAAATALGICLQGARRDLDAPAATGPGDRGERLAPLAGLVAAFVFAAQMLNFPVAGGTSGHLLGGALACALAGPYTAILCVTVVLLVQGLLFADGGLTALGVNVLVMGVVTVLVAQALLRGLLAVLPRTHRSVTAAAFTAALVSVPASAVAFTLLYALGGTTGIPLGTVLGAMAGVHLLIGAGEAVITALTVGAVLAVRPDLVHAARGVHRPLQLGTAPAPPPKTAAPPRRFLFAGLAVAAVLAGGVSFYASASPDGLEKVAADHGMDEHAEEHAAADSPLADYGFGDLTDDRLATGLAGLTGVAVTVTAGTAVLYPVVRRRRAARHARTPRRDG
ncbi:energy-coupling factor ABC transporter permease [Streptomyces sp. NPDC000594]|uniref:energy-coupling factor ABC transporter permease n=1 Tax=Streptomyces sp. NPDC000594 TaxID=3154261 RepID=UPI00331F9648